MSKTVLAIAPGLILAFIIAATLSSPALAAVTVGDKAPDFTLGSVDGSGTVKLSDYTSQPTLLVFWVSWCPHCQREVPVLDKIYRDLHPKGMNAVGVSVDDDITDASDFVKKYSITFPSGFAGTEAGQNLQKTYGVEGVPTMFIIDKGGTVTAYHVGETDEQTIRDDFAKLGVK